jgi:hypothetical protein
MTAKRPRKNSLDHYPVDGQPQASETLYPTALNNKRGDGYWSICSHLAVPNLLPTRYDNLAEAEPGLTWCDQVPGWPLPLPETQASVLGMAKTGINVPAPKEEYSCQTSELIRNDRASIA